MLWRVDALSPAKPHPRSRETFRTAMIEIGKWIAATGAFLLVLGLAVWGLGRIGFRGLPGDIRYETDNVRVYVPIVSMLVLSVVLTLLLWVVRWISGR